MNYPYIIVDDSQEGILNTRAIASGFHNLSYVGATTDFEEGIDLVLEHRPALIFLEISPESANSKLSLSFISELHRYLTTVPQIIITTKNSALAFDAIKYDVADFLLKPLKLADFRKAILKLEKKTGNSGPHIALPVIFPPTLSSASVEQSVNTPEVVTAPIEEEPVSNESAKDYITEGIEREEKKPLVICVKSYGDYRFINASDICYLQADNNSTDIHLNNGEMITAFKTLKHFENVLDRPFVRIHNSYIVNSDYVSRIHTGNAVCYIKNSTIKLPFSKSYKENVDSILETIIQGNYLEI
ncbi:MAG: response regulator transcription factor [Flavobacterium sp.]|nr:MAG: response regulator transcription factor [Flavobacterium sp.]